MIREACPWPVTGIAFKMRVDRCVQHQRRTAAAAALFPDDVAGASAHRAVFRLQARLGHVVRHELVHVADSAGRAVDVRQVGKKLLQAPGIDPGAGLFIPALLLRRKG
ncbi:hypothetical protein D3C72_1789730 [compost metagenome]